MNWISMFLFLKTITMCIVSLLKWLDYLLLKKQWRIGNRESPFLNGELLLMVCFWKLMDWITFFPGDDSSTSLTVESSTSSDGFAEESTVSEVPLSSVSPGHPELRNLSAPLGSSIHLPCPVKLHQGFIRATAYPRVGSFYT